MEYGENVERERERFVAIIELCCCLVLSAQLVEMAGLS